MNRKEIIERKLSALKPQYLKITNDSHLHVGHITSPNNGESHFTIEIEGDSISHETLINQHKIINNLIKEEFDNGLHALSIKVIKKHKPL